MPKANIWLPTNSQELSVCHLSMDKPVLPPFYCWESEGSEKFNNLTKSKQLANGQGLLIPKLTISCKYVDNLLTFWVFQFCFHLNNGGIKYKFFQAFLSSHTRLILNILPWCCGFFFFFYISDWTQLFSSKTKSNKATIP